jgi:arylsulfatase
MDLMPTFLEIAGIEYPATASGQMEGRSILSMIRGADAPSDRTICWEHEGNRAIRRGDWKLTMLATAPAWELFDLAHDRSELANLADERPELVHELSAEYDRWAERCGVAPWPPIEAERPKPSSAK